MGLMDKVKAQATQLAQQAQQGVAQGQAKLTDMQIRKQADGLLRDLGAAVYAAQRQAGPHEPVEAAMNALDAHAAEHGAIDTAPRAAQPTAPPQQNQPHAATPPQQSHPHDQPPTAGGAGAHDAGGYNLDDL
jgi:hypothetical protein